MAKWEVSFFTVLTSTKDQTSDMLYANGLMQIPVDVYIKAIDPDTNDQYSLTQTELNGIKLVDYNDTANELKGAWSYSDQANEYAHSLGTSGSPNLGMYISSSVEIPYLSQIPLARAHQGAKNVRSSSNASTQSETPQWKRFWVTTTNIECKNIAASIQQGDGTTETTHDGKSFDSHVTLTGIEAITYTTDTISIERDNTTRGTYQFTYSTDGTNTTHTGQATWDQQNYFVTTKAHTLLKAEMSGYDSTGTSNGYESDTKLANCYSYQVENFGERLSLFFVWDYGTETTKTSGVSRSVTVQFDSSTSVTFQLPAYTDITFNQKKNALCLTHLGFDFWYQVWWGDLWHYKCRLKLFDIYGNTGVFSAGFSEDYSQLVIWNANPSSDSAADNGTPIKDS